MHPVAYIHNDFKEKFGIPRQSGLVSNVSCITFVHPYDDPAALRGIEEFTHLWLLWDFSESHRETFSPTVRPPRLGGNTRVGVFATRSPFRPNSIGLSCVKLLGTETKGKDGPKLYVQGADLMDGTPIYDIKPYLSFTDSHPEAKDGFAGEKLEKNLQVAFPEELLIALPADKREALLSALSQDPRPAYQQDGEQYGFEFSGFDVRFSVDGDTLTVFDVAPAGSQKLK